MENPNEQEQQIHQQGNLQYIFDQQNLRIVALFLFLTLGFVIIFILYMMGTFIYFFYMDSPVCWSELNSFSVISPSNSTATKYEVVFSVRASYFYLGVKTATAYVFYEKQRIWDSYIEPFDVIKHEEKKIHLNYSSPSLPEQVAGDIRFDKGKNYGIGGFSGFRFRLEGIGRVFDSNVTIEISCDHFKIGFSSDSDIAQLIGEPKKCNVVFDGIEQ